MRARANEPATSDGRAPAAVTTAPREHDELPPGIAPPETECHVVGSSSRPIEVALHPAGATFATVAFAARTELAIPSGPTPEDLVISVEMEGLHVAGHARRDAITLYTKHPLDIAGLARTHAETRFTLRRAEDMDAIVSTTLRDLEPIGEPLEERVACGDLAFEQEDFAAPEVGGGVERDLEVGTEIAISPSDPPRARIVRATNVHVVETRGRRTRIEWRDQQRNVLHGWVATSALSRSTTLTGSYRYGPALRMGAVNRPPALVCDVDLPLIVDFLGDRVRVGIAGAGARFRVVEPFGAWPAIALEAPGLTFVDFVKVRAPAADLARCRHVR